jgi:hypothetical protein
MDLHLIALLSRDMMVRWAVIIAAVVSAALVAMLTESVAHDRLGIPLDAIRMDALSAAGLILAVVAGGSLLTPKK